MATCVEAGGLTFIIDPGVALGPSRYGLPPHPVELAAKERLWRRVVERAERAHVVVITHYHYDHHNPKEPELFRDKVLLIKDPEKNINRSQRGRARFFLDAVREVAREIEVADGREFDFGSVRLLFSPAQPHGFTSRLGYVLQVLIEEGGKRFLYTSDIQGAPLPEHVDFILDTRPDIIFMDGPATYLYPVRFSPKALEASLEHISLILDRVGPEHLIVDHHTTRDINYMRWFKGLRTITAARFMGREEMFLEAWRKRLYRDEVGFSPEQVQ